MAAEAAGADEFFQREQAARWLLVHDTVCLMAEDAHDVQAGAGARDWLCHQDGNDWIAVAGTYDDLAHRLAATAMYRVDAAAVLPVTPEMGPHAQALSRASHLALAELDEPKLWTRYARAVDGGIEVWALPVSQPGVATLGDTLRWTFDAGGKQVLARDQWSSGHMDLSPNPDLDLTLQSSELAHPTVGELFFALYHRADFKSITIETQQYRVTLTELDGSLGWARAAR